MNRHICIHCHFYQPPRENPWLEEVEFQETAFPAHDWNERITHECYEANGASRILDHHGWVTEVVNNYAYISFNFGPTLLSWLEEQQPFTYERILEGDRQSLKRFSGHGSAIAQAYNHIIMPLANRKDRETQVIWGLRDFEKRFSRYPESMWLPETAVDTESLEILAHYGMKYIILAPRQAKAVRPIGGDQPWQNVSEDSLDITQPYLINLPGGKSIAAFFYNGPISRAVAFEKLLESGEKFANRIMQGFQNNDGPQLVHLATDGETYGHHHRYGDMALAYAMHHIQQHKLAVITNYGDYLEKHAPKMEAQIYENSSWSCAHGVERWRNDCGCNTGMNNGWNQKWRMPLRQSFDILRDKVTPLYETYMKKLGLDPWAARDRYINIILDRDPANVEKELTAIAPSVKKDQWISLLKALELQRHLLLMYTSCAWFFDEVSGIEPVQNLQYAYRAIELASDLFSRNFEDMFVRSLEKIPSNIPKFKNGVAIFKQLVKPAKVNFEIIAAHFAVSIVFEDYEETSRVYSYTIHVDNLKRLESGSAKMVYGAGEITSTITTETKTIHFCTVYFGAHNVSAGVHVNLRHRELFIHFVKEIAESLQGGDFSHVFQHLVRHYRSHLYSIKDLLKDEQRYLARNILSETLNSTYERFFSLYERYYPLMRYLSDLHIVLPPVFYSIAQVVHNQEITRLMEEETPIRPMIIKKYLHEAKRWNTQLNQEELKSTYESVILDKMKALIAEPHPKLSAMNDLIAALHLMPDLPFEVNLGSVQNLFFLWANNRFEHNPFEAIKDSKKLTDWQQAFKALSQALKVHYG